MIFFGLVIYFVFLVLIGAFLARKNINFDDYFYAGRKLGSWLIFFTVTASWFGAASTIATLENALEHGFRSIWLLGIPTITTLLVFIFLNKKIRRIKFISLPILFGKSYGRTVAILASYLIFIYMVLLGASQFVAWGRFVSPILGTSQTTTILVGAFIVILYSYMGGYRSVVFTDGIQFFLLIVAIVCLMHFFINKPIPFSSDDFNIFSNLHEHMLMTLSFTLAWIISPIVWQRIASAKSREASRRGLTLSIMATILLYGSVILIAISLRSLSNPNLGHLIAHVLPQTTGILVFIGIAAAIMSTCDTAINLGALTLVKDILPGQSSRFLIHRSQISTLVAGSLSALIALKFDSIIHTLGLASEILAEGLFIPGMVALFFKIKKPLAGLFSIGAGGGFAILVFLNSCGLALALPKWPDSLTYGLLLSLTGFGVGFLLEKFRPSHRNWQDKIKDESASELTGEP
jgi:SSS family solute:Na+ symporter